MTGCIDSDALVAIVGLVVLAGFLAFVLWLSHEAGE